MCDESFFFREIKLSGEREGERERPVEADGSSRARGLQLLDLMLIPPPEANPGVRIP